MQTKKSGCLREGQDKRFPMLAVKGDLDKHKTQLRLFPFFFYVKGTP